MRQEPSSLAHQEQSGSCSETWLLTHCLTPTLMLKLWCSSPLPHLLPPQAYSCRGGPRFAGWGPEPPALDRTHFYILSAGNNRLYLKRMWIQSAKKSNQQLGRAIEEHLLFLPTVDGGCETHARGSRVCVGRS